MVLTKVDISGPDRANGWSDYLRRRYPDVRVVHVESYVPKEPGPNEEGTSTRKRRFEPQLPETFRERLVQALREVHQELLQPPQLIGGHEAEMKHWKPTVKADVDWTAVLSARGDKVGQAVGGPVAPRQNALESAVEDGEPLEEKQEIAEVAERDFLTIGLIGWWENVQLSHSFPTDANTVVGTLERRSAQRREVFSVECIVWYNQSSGFKNPWEGQQQISMFWKLVAILTFDVSDQTLSNTLLDR